MPYALIAKASAGSADTNNVTTGAIDSSNATLLIAIVSDFAAAGATTLSDSKGNTWNGLTIRTAASGARTKIYWSTPSSVGAGHTATASSAGLFPSVDFRAYSGALTSSSPFDVENGTGSNGVTTLQTGSVTPTVDNSLIIAAAAADTGTGFSINLSFTNLDNVASTANHEALGGADLIQTALAAVNPTWTNSGVSNLAVAIAVFKPQPTALGNMLLVF